MMEMYLAPLHMVYIFRSILQGWTYPINTKVRRLVNLEMFLTNTIQLLTIEALDMMWYRPESTNIDQGGAEVNIGNQVEITSCQMPQ